jgi:hypothetical protein
VKFLKRLLTSNQSSRDDQTPAHDPRWEQFLKLNEEIGFRYPDDWKGSPKAEPNAHLSNHSDDILAEDFCRSGEWLFVRCILPVPLIGIDHEYNFGVWCTIHSEHFRMYLDVFDTLQHSHLPTIQGWLGNQTHPKSTFPIDGRITFQDDGSRPIYDVDDKTHVLYHLQENGMSFDELMEIYDWLGSPMRNQLLNG